MCIHSPETSESCIIFGRGVRSLHCADVYLGIQLKGHEVQSVAGALMMLRKLRVFAWNWSHCILPGNVLAWF